MENTQNASVVKPVIVSLGKKKKSRIKKLKRGRGPLLEDVHDTIEDVQIQLGENAKGKVIVPVVMIVKEKPRRKKNALFPFAGKN